MNKQILDSLTKIAVLILVTVGSQLVFAEDDDDTEEDFQYSYTSADINHIARDEVSLRLEPLGFGLMGDSIDKYTGTMVFNQTDVSIPGNSELEVAIRRIAAANEMTNMQEGFFGDWVLDVPNISSISDVTRGGHFSCVENMLYDDEAARATDSSNGGAVNLSPGAYWDGMKLNIPGQGSKILLENIRPVLTTHGFSKSLWRPFSPKVYSDGNPGDYQADGVGRVTKDHWVVTCINPGSSGSDAPSWNSEDHSTHSFDGFIAISPEGIQYRMDKHIVMKANDYDRSGIFLERNMGRFYATEVTDVYGNWVRYDWSLEGKLTRIYSNDGREITLTYHTDSSLIASVTTNGRTWTYTYQTVSGGTSNNPVEISALYRVTQPDEKYWEYDLTFMLNKIHSTVRLYSESDGMVNPSLNAYVKHPYGVRADYGIGLVRHMNKRFNPGGGNIYFPRYRKTYSVLSKTLSGPSIPTSVWEYEYEQFHLDQNFSGEDTKTTTVIQPDGSTNLLHYYRDDDTDNVHSLEGKLAKEEVFSSVGNVLEVTDYTYELGDPIGAVTYLSAQNDRITRHTYLTSKVITRGADVYTTEYEYNTDQNSTDYSYHKPVSVKTYSNLSTAARETVTDYTHRKDHWVLNLPEAVTINNRLTSGFGYTDLGQKQWENKYGIRVADYAYHDGTVNLSADDEKGLLYSMTDANGNTSYWRNYYRGAAKNIERPDGLQDSYIVDANAWVISMTDYAGFTTAYEHDNMGRLTKIMPSKTQKEWVDTEITYAFGDEVLQTITRGDQRETVIYDTLFRSIKEQKYDLLNNESIYLAMSYDAAGRKAFQSFPSPTAVPTNGMEYTYDALGRQRTVRENVTPFATTSTDYLDNHIKKVTDASGAATRYYYSGYHSSGTKELLKIEQPLGVTTEIIRNIWGERTELKQSGIYNDNLLSETQKYYYDSRRRLCGHFTPEGGLTRYAYDAASRMTSYQKGAADSATCSAPSGLDLVSLTYDALDRVTKTDFADAGTPDIDTSYDNNGNVLALNRDGVNWTYTYDELNQITSERLVVDGRNYDLTYSYDTSGNMIQRTLPSGRPIVYSYDGFGRVTNIKSGTQTYADEFTYHPNNAISTMSYGNGQEFSQTLNARLLPSRLLSELGITKALDLNYSYDARADVTSIVDGVNSVNNKTMTYDSLGRLATASGVWGTGSFTYDPLGNLRQKQLSSRSVTLSYDLNNRVTQSEDTAGSTRNITYDNRGNVTTLGDLGFIYDKAQQPKQLTGSSSGTYTYDGNLKRVKAVVDGKTIYNVYDAAGKLVHVDSRDTGDSIEVCLMSCDDVDIPKGTDYIKAGNKTIARISNGKPTYLHADVLGSPQAGSNASGALVWTEQYTPYGEKVSAHEDNDDLGGYTGHISDSATGLTYMQARYYDPVMGRFLSIDPVGFKASLPVSFNRYSYVANNPIRNIDPDGEFLLQAAGVVGGAVLGITVQAVSDVVTGNVSSFGSYAGAAAGGAAAGLVATTTFNPAAAASVAATVGKSVAAGAIGGATSSVVQQSVDTGKVSDVAAVGKSMLTGAAIGALVPGVKFLGVTSGRNSYSAVAKTAQTKLNNGTISSISNKTVGKAIAADVIEGSGQAGASAAASISEKDEKEPVSGDG